MILKRFPALMSMHTHARRGNSGCWWLGGGELRRAGEKLVEGAGTGEQPRLQSPFGSYCLAAESGSSSLPWCVPMFILLHGMWHRVSSGMLKRWNIISNATAHDVQRIEKNEKVRYTDTECLLASRQVNKAKLALFIEGCRLLLTPPVLDKFKFSQKV